MRRVARGGAAAAEDFFSGSPEGAGREEEGAAGAGSASTGNRSGRSCGTERRTAGRGRRDALGAKGAEGSVEPRSGEARRGGARRGEGEERREEAAEVVAEEEGEEEREGEGGERPGGKKEEGEGEVVLSAMPTAAAAVVRAASFCNVCQSVALNGAMRGFWRHG